MMQDALNRNPRQRWQDLGPTLGRYAIALYPDARLLPIRDTGCVPLGLTTTALVLTDVSACAAQARPTETFKSTYRYVAFAAPWVKKDSVRVDVCEPPCG